jgi:hypothetical protein
MEAALADRVAAAIAAGAEGHGGGDPDEGMLDEAEEAAEAAAAAAAAAVAAAAAAAAGVAEVGEVEEEEGIEEVEEEVDARPVEAYRRVPLGLERG